MAKERPRIAWPYGRDFAFTVFDDTDHATLQNVGSVYALLGDLGFQTTKSVWTLPPAEGAPRPRIGGATCEDPAYVQWLHGLQRQGFEIALHNVSPSTSPRGHTEAGLRRFEDLFGHKPHTLANHAGNHESIYWGPARLSGSRRLLYQALTRRKRDVFRGEVEAHALFWGDLCRDTVRYVRNFVFSEIDTLSICPQMPYYDPMRPYVRYWYASSEGANVVKYNSLISEENQDKLAENGGACIAYTHFASGFYEDGSINQEFRRLMKRLSGLNGWFVPVHELLDFLRNLKPKSVLASAEQSRLEWRWLAHKLAMGGTS